MKRCCGVETNVGCARLEKGGAEEEQSEVQEVDCGEVWRRAFKGARRPKK